MNNKKEWFTRIILGTLILAMVMTSVGCGRASDDDNFVEKGTPEPELEEEDISRLIFFTPATMGWDAYIACISPNLPCYRLEYSTTNSSITFFDPKADKNEKYKKNSCVITERELGTGMPVMLTTFIPDSKPGEPVRTEIDGSPIVISLVIHNGDSIGGYGLIALWDPMITDDGTFIRFDRQEVLKAVTFRVGALFPVVSYEKVQALLDAAEQTLIVDAGLFEGNGK